MSKMTTGVNIVSQSVTPKSLQMTAVMVVTLPDHHRVSVSAEVFRKRRLIGSLKE